MPKGLTCPSSRRIFVQVNRPKGQSVWTSTKRKASLHTRQRLLDAAAELIAERGWGQVTTRAIAERAGLPHGTVSYHF